jgi:hypothetical protein
VDIFFSVRSALRSVAVVAEFGWRPGVWLAFFERVIAGWQRHKGAGLRLRPIPLGPAWELGQTPPATPPLGRTRPPILHSEGRPLGGGEAPPKPPKKPKLEAGTPEHKAQRWEDYKAKGGKMDYDRWSKQYDTNMRNTKVGLNREAEYREAMGGVSETVKTPYTNRQIDVSIREQDYMGQVKTGKVSLTEQAKIDIKKDAYLVEVEGKKVEYILEKGASKPFLDALKENGIDYKIGPQIPKK